MTQIDIPHRRYNPLTGEWVLVSPHRAKRPWQGQVEKIAAEKLPAYDPSCYLCPTNERAGGVRNPDYTNSYVFDNDFAALLPNVELKDQEYQETHPLLTLEPEQGLCRVVCFSPRHNLSLPEMSLNGIENVLETWTTQTVDLGNRNFIGYVQVFENKGAVMGCSNPHPHSQIWATGHIPNEPAKELAMQRKYYSDHNSTLLGDYIALEHQQKERLIFANEHFSAVVPFWAIWPFEVLVIAHGNVSRLSELKSIEFSALAEVFKQVTTRYDNLFEISFPYSMGFHQAPADGQRHPEWRLHAHFYPPLLRSATVKKFMVGFEMLGMPQRDITPEAAAERLRITSDIHYKQIAQQ